MWFPELGRMSLRGRLVLMVSIGLGLTLSIGFVGLHHVVRNEIYDSAWSRLEKRRLALADFATLHPGAESAADEMLEFRSKAHEDYFEIRDGRGGLLARSESSAGRDLDPPPPGSNGDAVRYSLHLPDGHPGIATWGVATLPAQDPRGHLTIIVARETAPLAALETRIHKTMLLVALSTLATGVLATVLAIRRGLAPVERLARSAESIEPDGPRRQLEIGPLPRELVVLGEKLNLLLHRLFDVRDRERRFTRSVAHELRTPLAEMRIIADVGILSSSLEEARSSLREVSAVTDELQQMVNALLALARYESGQEKPQIEPVNLADTLQRELRQLGPEARARALSIDCDVTRERWIIADPTLLRRLIANLVGNSVAHAPPGSTIRVRLGNEGPMAITNPAPQLAPEDVALLSERFYRSTCGDGNGHAGLGVPLAQAIASVCGMRLTFNLDSERRLSASLDGFRNLEEQGGHGDS